MDENSTISDNQWPKIACLSMGGLMQQSHVCRDVIKIVEVTLVTEHAWPELHRGTHYKREVLLDAVNALQAKIKKDDDSNGKQDKQYKALHDRILKDEKFVWTIGKWVCDLFLLY